MREGEIRMSKRESERLEILVMVTGKKLSQVEASETLGVSYRQTKRMVARLKKEGPKGIVHRSRGKASYRRIAEETRDKILWLYREKYPDFGPTFFTEKLAEHHEIVVSAESVRKLLIGCGYYETKARKKQSLHVWRERKEHEGEMTQIDGSHHRWLEERLDQEFCLMGYIDDATNKVFGRFYEYEGVFPVLDSFQAFVKKNGLPSSVYLDRHSTYKVNRKTSIDEDLEGEGPNTQFEAVMKQLGVTVIHARSPQAKGRIERLFETLQDRLVKELRLANVCTIEDANRFLVTYLEKHNTRLQVSAKKPSSFFKVLPPDFEYQWTFVVRATRVIAGDYTIRFCNRVFLVKNPTRSLRRQKVQIRQALDGQLRFETKHRILTVSEVSDAAIDRVKVAQKELKASLKKYRPDCKKSKKSWMDNTYFGKRAFAPVYTSTLAQPRVTQTQAVA